MPDYDAQAAQYRKEAAQEKAMTPTPADRKKMEEEAKRTKQSAASTEAYNKASPIGKSILPVPEKKYAKGGSIRGDGIAQRGKTKGRMV